MGREMHQKPITVWLLNYLCCGPDVSFHAPFDTHNTSLSSNMPGEHLCGWQLGKTSCRYSRGPCGSFETRTDTYVRTEIHPPYTQTSTLKMETACASETSAKLPTSTSCKHPGAELTSVGEIGQLFTSVTLPLAASEQETVWTPGSVWTLEERFISAFDGNQTHIFVSSTP
jgi:hypothetical protein